ncbi:hypothetical protein D3C85_1508130 [compost metagenome]
MLDRARNGDIRQAQDLVFLGIVEGLRITATPESRHAVHLVLVRRASHMLAIAQQEYRIGLQALGAVIGQLLETPRLRVEARFVVDQWL